MTETNEQYTARIQASGLDSRLKTFFLELGQKAQEGWEVVEAGQIFKNLCRDIVFSENSVIMRDGDLYMIFIPEWSLVSNVKMDKWGYFDVENEQSFEEFLKG